MLLGQTTKTLASSGLAGRNLHSGSGRLRRVVVTGLGLLSPLGANLETSWQNLVAGRSGITAVRDSGSRFKDLPCQIAGYIPGIDEILEREFSRNQLRTYSRAGLYTLLAVREALDHGRWSSEPPAANGARRRGVSIGTGMINFDDVLEAGQQPPHRVSPHFITKILLNMPAGYVSMSHDWRGPNHTVSTACTSGAHAIGDAYNFIRLNYADVMLAGGVEAPINPLSFGSFCRIRALCTRYNHQPAKASRPFDQNRAGFVMGESAAILLLEELQHAKCRRATIYGEILGYGLSADAHHVTAPSEDGRGARDSMQSAMQDADLTVARIGHINCHATSTPLGDQIELKAIEELFQDHPTFTITSTKSSTGHLLGAAGAAEAIFCLLTCHHGTIPPTLNLDNPIPTTINIVGHNSQTWSEQNRIAMTNSFGFGGTNASLIIGNYIE